MVVYDDKRQGTISVGEANNRFVVSEVISDGEIFFKASYIVATNLKTHGKITALFDLIVLGDVTASDIDVKGAFICLGNCEVERTIVVNGKITARSIKANTVEVHDQVVAQEIDVGTIRAEGNIIVGQTLAIEDLAYSEQNILCGETAYGAGRISATCISTVEELDLDNGKDAVVNPNKIDFGRKDKTTDPNPGGKFISTNNFNAYLDKLFGENDSNLLASLDRWKKALSTAESLLKNNSQKNLNCYDLGLLLTLTEISHSKYFSGWTRVQDWSTKIQAYFEKLIGGDPSANVDIAMSISDFKVGKRVVHKGVNNSYGAGQIITVQDDKIKVLFDIGSEKEFSLLLGSKFFSREKVVADDINEIIGRLFISPSSYVEWLSFLLILKLYGDLYQPKLVEIAEDLLYSKIGLKTKFIKDRIKENGWGKR